MYARFFKRGKPIGYCKCSSICFGLAESVQTLQLDVLWNVGSNSTCCLWHDDWTTASALIDIYPIPAELWNNHDMTVGDFTVDGRIQLPQQLLSLFISNQLHLLEIVVPVEEVEDELVWEGVASGILTVKEAYEYYREKGIKIN